MYIHFLQSIKVDQNLGEFFELEPLRDTHADTYQSRDNGKSEPNSCWKKTKLCFSSPIKSDDHSDVVAEESYWSRSKKYFCGKTFRYKNMSKIIQIYT